MTPKRFIVFLVCATLLLIGALASFNLVVDPYLVFGMKRWKGFNNVKPAVETHEAMMKVYQASRVQARTVILGSSRTDIGQDPHSSAWPESYRPVYNLSLAGSGIETSLHYLKHMMASNGQQVPTSTLIVGLDFEDFLVLPPQQSGSFTQNATEQKVGNKNDRLVVLEDGKPNPEHAMQVLKDEATSLFSLDALLDSLRTVYASHFSPKADLYADGQLSSGLMSASVRSDGLAMIFEQKFATTVPKYAGTHRMLAGTVGGDGLSGVQALIDFAKSRNMKLILVIQPAHVIWLEMLDFFGYWSDYEQWRLALTQRVATMKQAGTDVSLWDFEGYNRYSEETIPESTDHRTMMHWYWDPVHHTTNLGEVIIKRILVPDSDGSFGVQLTPNTISSHLVTLTKGREEYRASHSPEVAQYRMLFCKYTVCGTR